MTIRKKPPTGDHTFVSIFPILFWYDCFICKNQFRREKGYATLAGPYFNGRGRYYHVCGRCAKSKEEASQKFTKALQDYKEKTKPRPPKPMKPQSLEPKTQVYM